IGDRAQYEVMSGRLGVTDLICSPCGTDPGHGRSGEVGRRTGDLTALPSNQFNVISIFLQ
ncbi:MAG TPA: hypothetical protein VFQ52_07055, partial [Rhizomicrobium sp.]|nr:hypothetical protein [Rhizomicrobium sp.]